MCNIGNLYLCSSQSIVILARDSDTENKERVHSFARASLGKWPHGTPGVYGNYVTI
jgi:hypothetical protein